MYVRYFCVANFRHTDAGAGERFTNRLYEPMYYRSPFPRGEGVRGVRATYRSRSRGSRMSRILSPSMLKEKTVSRMATPGPMLIHQKPFER